MSFPRYDSYKDSGVEWLGEVPSHWKVQRLKVSVSSCRNGIWGEEPDGTGNDVMCVRVADFDRLHFTVSLRRPTFRYVTEKERVGRILRSGNLLLEKSGGGETQPVGAVVLFEHSGPAICSNFVARMELAQHMNPAFWTYAHAAIYSLRITERSINQTSGIQNLDQLRYFNEEFCYPPHSEQIKIGAFLDRETAKLDGAIEAQRRLIALLKEKRQAVISHAVTKGLDPTALMRPSGVAWLGDVPAHWSVRALQDLTPPDRAVMYGIVLPGPNVETGIPIVKGGDVKPDRLVPAKLCKTTAEIETPFARARLRANDIVYSIRGSIGEAELVPNELTNANITQDVARISPAGHVSFRWLLSVMRSKPVFAQLEQGLTGAAVRGINIYDLKRARIPVPPRHEQEGIAGFLDEETQTIARLQADAQSAITLLQERRSALISAAVTGKMDVRGLASAPAEGATAEAA